MNYALLRSLEKVEVLRLDSVQAGCEVWEPLRAFRWDAAGFDAFDRAIDLVNRLNEAQEREDWATVARLERRPLRPRQIDNSVQPTVESNFGAKRPTQGARGKRS